MKTGFSQTLFAMKLTKLLSIKLLVCIILFGSCTEQKRDAKTPESEVVSKDNNTNQIMMDKSKEPVKAKLEELAYFEYVNPTNLDTTVEKTFENYKNDGEIQFPYEGLNRIFWIDAEFIYEADGIRDQIEGLLPMFKAMGIELTIGEYVEEFDNDSATYTKRIIELNGKKYDVSGVSDWRSAFDSGLKLVDEILKDFGKDERAFGLFMDESSTMIILNEPLAEYLIELIPEGSTYRPVDIKKMMTEN